jgi:hypothetical protein
VGLDVAQEGEVPPVDLQHCRVFRGATSGSRRLQGSPAGGDGSSAPAAQPSGVAPLGDGPQQGGAPAGHRRQHCAACSGQRVEGGDGQRGWAV